MRDNFSQVIKRNLAERVAWQCSFPGCDAVTIGPKENDSEGTVNLGEAAHIHAASALGPRYDAAMTPDQRSSAANGIWMCRHHARLIDADEQSFTAETLLRWKEQAEARAHKALVTRERASARLPTTFVLIGDDVVVETIWQSVSEKTWVFEIVGFIEGSVEQLREIVSTPIPLQTSAHFLVVETQGDGRLLMAGSTLSVTGEGCLVLTAQVAPAAQRISLADLSCDIALDEDGDIAFENGDFKMASGADLVKQQLTVVLNSGVGDYKQSPLLGSNLVHYYHKYKTRPLLLNRFLKLEIAHLASIPFLGMDGGFDNPTLNFIRRVECVELVEEIPPSRVLILVRVVLHDEMTWEGQVIVSLSEGQDEQDDLNFWASDIG